MMKVFVTADTHFGHLSLASEYQARPGDFETRILRNWRRVVSDSDTIIHLGDVVVGNATEWASIVRGLPGRKILVLGNHDRKSLRWYMTNGFDFCCQEFCWQMLGLRILFSHEPSLEGHFDLNIHGHLHLDRHREYTRDERHCLVALEGAAYEPQSLESIVGRWRRSNNAEQGEARQRDSAATSGGSGALMLPMQQVAVIAWQRTPALQVLLIRRLPDGRWGIPKGGIAEHGDNYHEAARAECMEEAGADGRLGPEFVGEFSYRRDGREHIVRVLLMEVTGLRDQYRELGRRERRWFRVDEAAGILSREPVRWLVNELPRWVGDDGSAIEPGAASDRGGTQSSSSA